MLAVVIMDMGNLQMLQLFVCSFSFVYLATHNYFLAISKESSRIRHENHACADLTHRLVQTA